MKYHLMTLHSSLIKFPSRDGQQSVTMCCVNWKQRTVCCTRCGNDVNNQISSATDGRQQQHPRRSVIIYLSLFVTAREPLHGVEIWEPIRKRFLQEMKMNNTRIERYMILTSFRYFTARDEINNFIFILFLFHIIL